MLWQEHGVKEKLQRAYEANLYITGWSASIGNANSTNKGDVCGSGRVGQKAKPHS